MKPNWKDAPEWANWLAMDADGAWYWYEHEPIAERRQWTSRDGESRLLLHRLPKHVNDWEDSMEHRPDIADAEFVEVVTGWQPSRAWAELVQKHTHNGACNFQGAADELQRMVREQCAEMADEHGEPDLARNIRKGN